MARLCPHCETKSRFDDIYPVRSVCSDENGFHFLQRCQECSGIVYSICNVDINAPQYKTAGRVTSSYGENGGEDIIPSKVFSYPFVSMNPPIVLSDSFEKSFIEGIKCLNVGAPFAAVVMFRKCLQIIVEDKGATGRDLKQKIQSLTTSGILSETLESISTVIREVGNDGAHPNIFSPSIQDAKDILDFLLLLIDQIYILPEKAERLKDRRTSIKDAKEAEI